MLISYKRGQTSVVLRVKIYDSSVTTGAGKTGLAYNTSGLKIATIADNEATTTVYTVAASNVETITTLGTFATPTASKCRFKEVDATNHPGVYEIHIANARFAVTSAKSLMVSISGATNAAECDVLIPLVDFDPYGASTSNISFAGGVTITQSSSSTPALSITGNGGGAGMKLIGGSSGAGLEIVGGSSTGDGVSVTTTSGNGITVAPGGGNGHSVSLIGNGSGNGLKIIGGATGNGLDLRGGGTSGNGAYIGATSGRGIYITAGGIANEGVQIGGIGGGAGLALVGGATGSALTLTGGSTSGTGLTVTTTSGNGITITSGGGNGDAIECNGNGSGHGIDVNAGATGNGIDVAGGSTSGIGVRVVGTANYGMRVDGGAAYAGLALYGNTSGAGLECTGGTLGNGVTITGGSSTGTGLAISGGASGGTGFSATGTGGYGGARFIGQGAAYGAQFVGGATGPGATFTGGSTSGVGINVTTTSGHAISAVATGTTKYGILAQGGATSSAGIKVVGGGTGAGLDIVPGTTGAGVLIVGGSTSGNGLTVTTTDGHGFSINAAGASKDGFIIVGAQYDINADIQGTVSGGGGLDAAGVRAAIGLASANLDTQLTPLADGVSLATPVGLKKNTETLFTFTMVDSTDHITPTAGLTVTAQRSLDGAALGSCANSVSEISNGIYKITLAAADTNADILTLRFTATGADPRVITITTEV